MLKSALLAASLLVNPASAGLGLSVGTTICTHNTRDNCEPRVRRCGTDDVLGPTRSRHWDHLKRIKLESNLKCSTTGMMDKIDPYKNKNYLLVEFSDKDGNCYEALTKPGECWGVHPETNNEYGCQGRCGAGCGGVVCSNWGPGCLSHDVCSWYFSATGGAFDEHCGDEYLWAAGQTTKFCFWWGRQECELSEHYTKYSKHDAICN